MNELVPAPQDVEARVRQIADDYLNCRLVGHSWVVDGGRRPHDFGTLMILRCSTCGMARHDVFDYRGQITARRYEAPAGYRFEGLEPWERPTRSDWRVEWSRRAPIDTTAIEAS